MKRANDVSFETGTAAGSGCCLCIAFTFALVGSISPYWLWSTSWFYYGYTSTVSTGANVVSAAGGSIPCGWWYNCYLTAQWNYISSFNNTLCVGDFYERVGQFGFCTEEGNISDSEFMQKEGVLRLPPQVVDIQGLSIATAVLTFVAMCAAWTAPAWQTMKMASCTAILSLAATCTAIGAFAVAASYDYYQNFRTNGWYLPFTTAQGDCDTDTCLVLSNRFVMWWGPAFGCMVTAFVFAFCATIGLLMIVADARMEARLQKAYKDEDSTFQAGGAPEVPPAQGAPAQETDNQNIMKG